jgi:hypothetical protein
MQAAQVEPEIDDWTANPFTEIQILRGRSVR